jgi:phospholipase/carboxylesterase
MPLASSWRASLPETRFTAPFHQEGGHEWFSVDGAQLQPGRIQAVREAFDKTIGDAAGKEGFENALARIAFVGVSQGAIVALDAVASGRWKVGALVSFAGLLPPTPVSGTSKDTPVLLVHGKDDRPIPSMASSVAAAQLETAGFKVELDIEPAVGHTISCTGRRRRSLSSGRLSPENGNRRSAWPFPFHER